MSKHTPGPWTAVVSDGDISLVATVALVGSCVVGVRFDETYNVNYENHGGEEADARLIAAAPELLAALESFLRAPSVGSGGPGSITIVVQDFNLRAARAAIAKATGGEA